ncbi:VOC family protein [Luteolibacter flavescens]|uniref:VOC family protein n=1 Tax=Luteolibacter flavescens TaxID=1859460 RepID=A0ABT3FJX0_9BACT|nr:VOC family protein [Luteolibacter flavescens]MCW1883835.1 VOC family protein [Luteolibacter flavescens]
MIIQPYLFFDGRCEEALAFYQKHLGAEVISSMRFKDSPVPPNCGPGGGTPDPEKIMHASFKLGESIIMVSDGNCEGKTKFDGFSLSITVKDKSEAERIFAVMSEGGQVCAPMTETFFSPAFGMLIDPFGVSWMVLVGQ